MLNESDLYPYETSDFSNNDCLVVAPHPDDESIGCGGSIVKHIKRGSRVKVIFLSHGEKGDFRGIFGAEYTKIRQKEAVKALSILGVKDFEFWGFADRELYKDKDLIFERLKKEAAAFSPSLVYFPSPYEAHPDHRTAAAIGWQFHQELLIPAAFYEILMPLYPDMLVNISGEFRMKESAVKCYETEMEYNDYLSKVEGLNRCRTLTLPAEVRYAEAFVYFNAEKRDTPGKRILKTLISHSTG
ncbi:MAG: PIG-L deacetylase family protein [Nitrospirota bacterium]